MARSTHDIPRLLVLTLVVGAALTPGCSRQRDVSLPRAASEPSEPSTREHETPTTSQAERWGNDFVTALAAGDVDSASRLIDWEAIFAAATSGSPVPEPLRARFVAEGTRGVARSGFVAQLARAAAGGSIAPIRCRTDGGECHMLVRVIQDTGLNYLDVRLVRRGGQTVASDAYVFLAGECLSETIRRLFLITTTGDRTVATSPPPSVDDTATRHADVLRRLLTATDAGDHQQVLEIIAECPDDLLDEKPILMARAIAAVRAGEELHTQAFDELQSAFPEDACVDLVAIDHYARAQDRAACLAAIDRLDKRLGGDPYLDALRATVNAASGDYTEAIRTSEAAIKALPQLPQPCWIRLAISLEQQRHDDTATWLDILSERFGVVFPDLGAIPEYAAFVRSPEYRDWTARRR